MPLFDPLMPLRYVRPLLDFVREAHPAGAAGIVAAAGLDADLLAAPGAMGAAQFDALVCAAARELGRSDIGFELGRRVNLDSHGALSQALRACASGDAMLRTVACYSRLITPAVSIKYQRGASGGEYVLRPAAPMSRTTLHALEEVFALTVHGSCKALLGETRGLEIHFSMPAPAHAARYLALAPARFVFGANALPEVRCHIPAGLLDRQLARPDPAPDPGLPAALRAAQHAIGRSDAISSWVALILREADGVQPSLARLAELLDVSPRTLSRLLGAEGCDLRKLGSEIRHRRACELLDTSTLPIEQVGQRLGYGSTSAFGLAFKKIQGLSPWHYRHRRAS